MSITPTPDMKLTYLTIAVGVTNQVWMGYAARPVILNGHIEHFKNGIAALTFSCGLANVWMDPENRSRISHPVRTASVIKTRAYVLTGFTKDGIGVWIQYAHSLGNIVDMNDDGTIKKMIENHPEQLEREFEFRTITKIKRSIKSGPTVKRTNTGVRKAIFPKGAIARAFNAGLLSPAEAQERARKQDEYEYKRTMSALHSKDKV